uniref:HTH CENPB-type domain-containing protein n=1 Tax=Meloidogyne floridensis TaxID=298350 RepID=A0A915P482_9BILA
MAALSTLVELMARASATVFSQVYTNALEKAAQQQQQHHQQQLNLQSQQALVPSKKFSFSAAFPMFPALMASVSIPQTMPCISPISQQHQQQHQIRPLPIEMPNNTSTNNILIPSKVHPQQQSQNLSENGCSTTKPNRKRKRSKTAGNAEGTPPIKQQILQEVEIKQPNNQQQLPSIEQQQSSSSTSPPSASRISSPDSNSIVHKGRKLKLYAAEEKTDIIDYAKCIGNRAAGREFNVAESSIREWRKNEEKIRKQAETTAGCTQHFEKNRGEILTRIDDELVKMLNSKDKRCTTWYGIAEQVTSLWEEITKELNIEISEMKITMGWISRFMRRNEHRVPKVTPPIIATSSSTNGTLTVASPSITRKNNVAASSTVQPIETRAKARSKASTSSTNAKLKQEKTTEDNNTKNILNESSCSRRKRFRPIRVDADCATLITSQSANQEEQQNGDNLQ